MNDGRLAGWGEGLFLEEEDRCREGGYLYQAPSQHHSRERTGNVRGVRRQDRNCIFFSDGRRKGTAKKFETQKDRFPGKSKLLDSRQLRQGRTITRSQKERFRKDHVGREKIPHVVLGKDRWSFLAYAQGKRETELGRGGQTTNQIRGGPRGKGIVGTLAARTGPGRSRKKGGKGGWAL